MPAAERPTSVETVLIKQDYPFTRPEGQREFSVTVEVWDGYGVKVIGAFGAPFVYKALKKAGGKEWAKWVRRLPRVSGVDRLDSGVFVPWMAFYEGDNWL